jgi:predicted O-methyltransferase YrrM
MGPVFKLKRLWRRTRKRPPGLRARYVRAVADRRLQPIAALCLHAATGRPVRELYEYLDELRAGEGLLAHLEEATADLLQTSERQASGTLLPAEGRFLYALVRGLRPDVVVETGTANGVSTSFALEALERNGAGRLVSIDLPFVEAGAGKVSAVVPGTEIGFWEGTPLPPGRESGWMVPGRLRGRWELRVGSAQELLAPTLAELGPIDVFFHDSLHTREHMLFEYETAWPEIKTGGVLLSDDIFQNDALPSFARSIGRRWGTYSLLGYVRKP